MTAPALPHVKVEGPPLERGRQLGAQAGTRIHKSIENYRETFAHYTGRDWSDVQRYAEAYRPAIDAYSPDILPEMEGIAAGAGVATSDILALNTRTEIMYGLSRTIRAECTSFGASSVATESGRVIIAQNWDWRPVTRDSCVLMEVTSDQGPSFITIVEAGLLAKMGFNSAGLGLVANLLLTDLDRGDHNVPFHVIMRAVLTAPSIAHAVHAIMRANRAASANYLIANVHGDLIDLESTPGGPDGVYLLAPANGLVSHGNTFCTVIPSADAGLQRLPDSPLRTKRSRKLLDASQGELTVEGAMAILRDHEGYPGSICRHPNADEHPVERLATNASVVIDLSDQTLYVAVGPPCEADFKALSPDFAMAPSRA